ncbi:MAG TPA: glycosyltransferase family 2 protein [Geobacteraceae bacterium]|nr:glycosyltransferase family 2 protein [Geobacteraceae bacterium]
MVNPTGISIVIPNYNGEGLLRENLPSIIAALEQWGGEHELIVVDDCSTDGSCLLIREAFPHVTLIVNTVNMGFSKTCNIGMGKVRYPVALCVNNDVKAAPDLIAPLVRHFADDDVFAVTPNILAEREGRNQGIVYGLYGKGFLKGGFAPLEERCGVRENLYAIGACVAYDMAKFRALGGYAEIFTPYLFEDVDISYRAWKRGWKSVYEPGATVYHYSSATIGKTKKRHKRTIYFRNRFLFHWINLTDQSFMLSNLLHTTLRLAVSFLWFDFPYYAAFWGALCRLGHAMELRKTVKAHLSLGDAEILRRTAGKTP